MPLSLDSVSRWYRCACFGCSGGSILLAGWIYLCQHNNSCQSPTPKLGFLVASPIGKANGKQGELSVKSQTTFTSARTGFSNLFHSSAKQNALESSLSIDGQRIRAYSKAVLRKGGVMPRPNVELCSSEIPAVFASCSRTRLCGRQAAGPHTASVAQHPHSQLLPKKREKKM